MAAKGAIARAFLVCVVTFILVVTSGAPALAAGEEPGKISTTPDSGPLPWWETTTRDKNRNYIEDALEAQPGPYRGLFVRYDGYPGASAQKLVEGLNLEVRFVDGGIDTILTGPASFAQVERLLNLPGVVFVELEPLFYPSLETSLAAMKIRTSSTYSPVAWDDFNSGSKAGEGINIAVLDTGVDDDHDFLDGSYIAGRDFYDLFDTGDGSANPNDNNGHGTHVASSALGHDPDKTYMGPAPKARLVDVKVMTDVGAGGYILQGLNWSLEHKDDDWENDGPANNGIQVVSLSAGSSSSSDGTDAVSQKANELVANGIVVVAAMGNNGQQEVPSPAAGDWVISVANMDDGDTITRDDDAINQGASNRGPRLDDGDGDAWDELKPDVSAPGTDITAAAYSPIGQGSGSSATATMTGTSMATPQVSGLVALLLQAEPDLKPGPGKNPVLWRLRNMSEQWGEVSYPDLSDRYNNWSGHGYLDGYNIVHDEAPDAVITQAWSSPAQAIEGDSVTLYATVANTGNIDLDSVTLEFYDGGAAEGTLIRQKYVENLAPDATLTISTGWSSPAVANHSVEVLLKDAYPDERSITNNNFSFYMEVKQRPSKPDLRVDSISLSDETPTEGQTVTVKATVTNVGQEKTDSAVVTFTHKTQEGGETELGRAILAGLDPDESAYPEVSWQAEEGEGQTLTVTLSSIEPDDADEANNKATRTIDVAGRPDAPDFTLTPFDISFDPQTASAGEEVTIELLVHNIGGEDGEGDVSLTVDGALLKEWEDVEIQSADEVILKAYWTVTGGDHEIEVDISAVTPEEADLDNNYAQARYVGLTAGPDFTIKKIDMPALLVAGQPTTFRATVRNLGDETGDFTLVFKADSKPLGSVEYQGLRPSQEKKLSFEWAPMLDSRKLEVTLTSAEDTNTQNNRAEAELTVSPPVEVAFDTPLRTGQPGETVAFELIIINRRSLPDSATLRVGGGTFQGNLTFTDSRTDTLSLDLTAKDYRQLTLEAQLANEVTAGNYSFEVSLDFNTYSTRLVGAVAAPIAPKPAEIELVQGRGGELALGLYNPQSKEVTYALESFGAPRGVTLLYLGREGDALLVLGGYDSQQVPLTIKAAADTRPGSYTVTLTLTPSTGSEVYQAAFTLVILEKADNGGDGFLPGFSAWLTMTALAAALVGAAGRRPRN